MGQNKERITGFIALAAIAVIVVPMLFDGQGVRESELQVHVAEPPRFPVMAISTPQLPRLPETIDPAPALAEPENVRRPRMAAPSQAKVEQTESRTDAATSEPEQQEQKTRKSLSLEHSVPVLDQQGVPAAWTLQLAAFKERGNAESLRDRLLKAGYKAYIREKNSLARVYIGPEVQRPVLEKLKAQLQQELKLDGLILRFTAG